MDSLQMLGMIEEPANNWFFENYRELQPIIGEYGANDGVLLMNLTRMREYDWVSKVVEIHNLYSKDQKEYYFDQGLINILLNKNSGI
jgi:UDP-xylose:glucoside alpha-1,3-xylosyltransferase